MLINQERIAYISHLDYTVSLKNSDYAPLHVKKQFQKYIAITYRPNWKESIIYMRFPIGDYQIPTLMHEIEHAVQNIAIDYGIDFIVEREHIAYLFQYIFNQFLGYQYI